MPSSGIDTKSIKRQLALLELLLCHVNKNGGRKAEAIVSFNCSQSSQLKKITKTFPGHVHFNNKDMGFDANIVRCFQLARGEYIHLLSENDYYCVAHFINIINIACAIERADAGGAEQPSFIIPLETAYDVPEGLNYQHTLIARLRKEAKSRRSVKLDSHEDLHGSILLCSQMSHFIARRDSTAVNKLEQLAQTNQTNLGGIAHSAYGWCLAYSNRNRGVATFSRVTQLNKKWMIFLPSKKRSDWFYKSTLYDAPNFYKNLPVYIKQLFNIDLDEKEERVCSIIAQSLASYGRKLLRSEQAIQDVYASKEYSLAHCLQAAKREINHLRRVLFFKLRYYKLYLGYIILSTGSLRTSKNQANTIINNDLTCKPPKTTRND